MREETLRALVPKLSARVFREGRDDPVRAERSGRGTCTSSSAGWSAAVPNNAQADPDRTLGPGELFPVGALSAGGATTEDLLRAAGHVLLSAVARGLPRAAARRRPEFERYCTQAITETLKQSLESLYSQYSQRAAEQQTLTRTLAELVRNPPVACAATATLREAAQKMADAKVRTIIVVDPRRRAGRHVHAGRPAAARRAARAPARRRRVSEVMSSPIVTLPASATAYEAMHVMAERGIRQIVVVEGGRLLGVINERDLFALQRVSMRQVIEGLHAADSIDELQTRRRGHPPADAEPARAGRGRRAADAHDRRAQRRAVAPRHRARRWSGTTLATSTGAGSRSAARAAASRRSRPTRTTRCCSPRPMPTTAAAQRERLLAFARDVNASLDALGFPLCTGNVMASNPELLPVDRGVEGQVPRVDPRADAAGAAQRQHRLRLPAALRRHDALRRAARMAVRLHAGEPDVPAADGAERARGRAAARADPHVRRRRRARPSRGRSTSRRAARGSSSTARASSRSRSASPTPARPPGCAGPASGCTSIARHVDATVEAFHFLQLLRLRQQDLAAAQGSPNRIDPYALHEIDQRMLKEAFRQAKQLQERLRLSYRL